MSKRVLLTGCNGYIGAVLQPMLQAAGYDVVGLDTYFFLGCVHGDAPGASGSSPERVDLREITPQHLEGCEGVLHLAALSNDPLGDLRPGLTRDINHSATIRLAKAAREAGVSRFVFSSSCSMYGATGTDAPLDESAELNPVTAYAESKIESERELTELASDSFSPVYLRNATAYGWSPQLRADLVVNNLTGWAYTNGEVHLKSDGTPWRPLIHVQDICRAFIAALEAPRERIHNEAFNVGRDEENYQIRDVAEIVRDVVPDSTITLSGSAGPDARNYRVSFQKISQQLPEFQPTWTVRAGAVELLEKFREHGLEFSDLEGARFTRIKKIQEHLEAGRLDDSLRWQTSAVSSGDSA